MPKLFEPLGNVLGGRYRLVASLGSGASAHVFLAEDMVLQRRVALKVLQPELARDETFLRRFRAEARSVAALNHPHVLRVFDWGEDDDGPFLVLEAMEGGSLFDVLARHRHLTPSQAARIGGEAAGGLAYAHAHGVVHRDVKPANLLFDEEGRVRVADFGVAHALSGSSLTDLGPTPGTARYASPEQAQGLPVDGRSDVYSLALVLFEAVAGSVPFLRSTPAETLRARIGASIPDDPALGLLGPLLVRAASPELDARPDAGGFAQALVELGRATGAGSPLPLVRRDVSGDGAYLSEDGRAGQHHADGSNEPWGDDTMAVPLGDATAELTTVAPQLSAPPAHGATAGPGAPPGPRAPVIGFQLPNTGEPTATLVVRPAGAARPPTQGTRRERRPRRWPWVTAVAVLVAVILAAAGYEIDTRGVFTASHAVPSVVGTTLASARRAISAEHFHVKVEPAVTSLHVPAGTVVHQTPAAGRRLKEGSTVAVVPSKGLPSVSVPVLSSDLTCSLARQLLSAAHLRAHCPATSVYSSTIPYGNVVSWAYHGKARPSSAPYGAVVAVTVSKGLRPVTLPALAGQTWGQAKATLTSDGLAVKEMLVYSTTVASGTVISTTPPTGSSASVGSTVSVVVSQGSQYVRVPTVVGDTVPVATSGIQAAGLSVAADYGPATGVVFTSDPLAGQRVKIGTAVALYSEPNPSGSSTGTPPATGGPPGATGTPPGHTPPGHT